MENVAQSNLREDLAKLVLEISFDSDQHQRLDRVA